MEIRKSYKGYAFGGLVEDECDNYTCETKEHAQRVEFAEKDVILYPNNEDPGKSCCIKLPQISDDPGKKSLSITYEIKKNCQKLDHKSLFLYQIGGNRMTFLTMTLLL